MNMNALIAKLELTINECQLDGSEPFKLQPSIDRNEAIPIDSMGLFDLGMKIEDAFGIRFSDEEIFQARNTRYLVELMKQRLGL